MNQLIVVCMAYSTANLLSVCVCVCVCVCAYNEHKQPQKLCSQGQDNSGGKKSSVALRREDVPRLAAR